MAIVRCPQCGSEISDQAVRCRNCGALQYQDTPSQPVPGGYGGGYQQPQAPVYQPPQAPVYQQPAQAYQQPPGGMPYSQGYGYESDEAILQSPEMRLLLGEEHYMEYIDSFRTRYSFNLSAFFFTACWFVYRKMYLYGVLALFVNLFLPLISNILVGFFANDMYKRWLVGIFRRSQSIQGFDRERFLRHQGGTSAEAVVIFVILYLVCYGFWIYYVLWGWFLTLFGLGAAASGTFI